MVKDCEPVKLPPFGEIVGAARASWEKISNSAEEGVLVEKP